MTERLAQIYAIKPDQPRIKQIKKLSTFIDQYPNQELVPHLVELNEQYQYYRPICGDGNCFYRSCIFLYLSHNNLNNFKDLFPDTPIINCKNLPIDFEDMNAKQVLKYGWREFLVPLADMDPYNRRKELEKILNQSLVLDVILIAYLRSLNHSYLMSRIKQLSSFFVDNPRKNIDSILEFGRQSEGVQLFSLAELLKVKITIAMVHQQNFQKIVYCEQGRYNFALFYRPGHYQILCEEEQYQKSHSQFRFSALSSIKSTIKNTFNRPKSEGLSILKVNAIKDLEKVPYKVIGSKKRLSNQPIRQRPSSIDDFYIKKQNKNEISSTKKSRIISKVDSQKKENNFQPIHVSGLNTPHINQTRLVIEGIAILLVLVLGLSAIFYR